MNRDNTMWLVADVEKATLKVSSVSIMMFPGGFEVVNPAWPSRLQMALTWIDMPSRTQSLDAMHALVLRPEWAWALAKMSPDQRPARP